MTMARGDQLVPDVVVGGQLGGLPWARVDPMSHL